MVLVGFNTISGKVNLKRIKSIGDEREDYTFFSISSAILTDTKDVVIADTKGHFIAKYDWQGNFVKKIGQKGQGPGDFRAPKSLNLYNGKIILHDKLNYRIAEMDLDFSNLQYYHKQDALTVFEDTIFVLKDKSILFVSNLILDENIGRIGIINKDGNVTRRFFTKTPIPMRIENKKDFLKLRNFNFFSTPRIGMNLNRTKLIVSFFNSNNPAEFFVYNLEGKLLMKFNHQFDDKYTFPGYYLKSAVKHPNVSYGIIISSLFIYKDKFIVFPILIRYKKQYPSHSRYLCLVFDRDGKFQDRLELKGHMKFYYISKDGYLLGKDHESEIERLDIFKIEF